MKNPKLKINTMPLQPCRAKHSSITNWRTDCDNLYVKDCLDLQACNDSIIKLVQKAAGPRVDVYIIGGYIRDIVIGRSTRDIDFVVPNSSKKLAHACAKKLNAPCITLDEDNQVYRVIHPKTKQYLDFALQQGKTILEDLARRDFTINAVAGSIMRGPLKKLLDPFGGLSDINEKKIRLVSKNAFTMDPLRLIRAFRFSAELGFTIEPFTMRCLKHNARLITRSAGERIREELFKICACSGSDKIIEEMAAVKLLDRLFPELKKCRNVAKTYYPRGGVLRHCLDTLHQMDYIVENTPLLFGKIRRPIDEYINKDTAVFPRHVLLKLAALLHDIGKPPTAKKIKGRLRFFLHEEAGAQLIGKIGRRFRLSRKETHFLQIIARAHMRPGNLAYVEEITDRAIHRFFRDYGEEGIAVLLVSLADRFCYISRKKIARKSDPHHKTILKLLNRYYLKKESILPPKLIDGHTLMKKLNLPEGPVIGKLLKLVVESQAEGKTRTKEQAIQLAKNQLKYI